MHSMALWPFLTVFAAGMAFVQIIEDSGQRSLIYWLLVTVLLAGVMAAVSHIWIA